MLVAPYSMDGKSFSTTNTLWSSKGETTLCAQKNWAVNNKLTKRFWCADYTTHHF